METSLSVSTDGSQVIRTKLARRPLKSHDGGVKTFLERLERAAGWQHIHWGQTSVGKSLGISKQTIDQWFKGNIPGVETIFLISDRWSLNPRWLALGEGDPKPSAPAKESDLEPSEIELLRRYRDSDPRWQLSLRLLSIISTEEQFELAGDVNTLIARIFGKKADDLKYPSDKKVRRIIGDAPHVLARKKKANHGS